MTLSLVRLGVLSFDIIKMDDRNTIRQSNKHKDGRTSKKSRSRSYSIDKCRSGRKKSDRTTHHRRRKINREELTNNGTSALILKSTTCIQRRKTTGLPIILSKMSGRINDTLSVKRKRSPNKFYEHNQISKYPYRVGLKINRSYSKFKPYIKEELLPQV